MREETIYDILKQCTRQGGDWKMSFQKKVIGMIVLTNYNNKTYKISDVNFDETVNSTFDYRGTHKSYLDYYIEVS